MPKRYFCKKDPLCKTEDIEWIEMSGREYYRFVIAPENKGRHFIDMGDVVLECTATEYRKYKAEDDHSKYLFDQEYGWTTHSLENLSREYGLCGEEIIADMTQEVETEVIHRIEIKALYSALEHLDTKSLEMIHELYFANECKTERELAQIASVSQNAIHKQKQKILKTLKFGVVKFQKNSQ